MNMIALIVQATSANGDFSILSLFMEADWVIKAIMVILIIASLWSWAIAIDKLITFNLLKKRATRFEDTFWSGRTLEDLSKGLANDIRDPMARVFAAAMREYEESRTGGTGGTLLGAQERIDRVMTLVVNRELSKTERGMSVLATVASASVFIGLLGTVWGVMRAFRDIDQSQSTNLSVVLPGITEALFLTALGLLAAIPALIFYNKFSNDLGKYAGRLEGYAEELSAILSRKIMKGG
jgi:biopolymer transport protein TolQ